MWQQDARRPGGRSLDAVRLDDVRRAHRRSVDQFFGGLTPRLASARRLERELDRTLARRFNVLDYLRTDELGLSRIVADLLNPDSSHGQGTAFLRSLLRLLNDSPHALPEFDLDSCRISLAPEHLTDTGRRIDIVVEIADRHTTVALAFENKPYARDLEDQLRDYLQHLSARYGDSFLLTYLPPRGEAPSARSVSVQELLRNWPGRFAILPYVPPKTAGETDGFEPFRLPFSLTEWLRSCRSGCEVGRLRWFLGDLAAFCEHTFGDKSMTSDHESLTIQDFLSENPDHFDTALAVYESWISIRDEVCKRFLDQINAGIKASAEQDIDADDLRIACAYGGDVADSNFIRLHRKRWTRYRETDFARSPLTGGRTAIELGSSRKGLNGWYIGVRVPKPVDTIPEGELHRRRRLRLDLQDEMGASEKPDDEWRWWDWVNREKRDWGLLLSALHRECQADDDGEITRYFVKKFVDVACKAILVIDNIEG